MIISEKFKGKIKKAYNTKKFNSNEVSDFSLREIKLHKVIHVVSFKTQQTSI